MYGIAAITYLQHTDPAVEYYDSTTWTFKRGAAATVDRDLGFIDRHFFYHAAETHVLHHHFTEIPFYHAKEATAAIRLILGTQYKHDEHSGALMFFKIL